MFKPNPIRKLAEQLLRDVGVQWHEVTWSKGELNGYMTNAPGCHLYAPLPKRMIHLALLAHECGHRVLHSAVNADGQRVPHVGDKPLHLIEVEAERWGRQWLACHGLTVPEDYLIGVTDYLFRHVEADALRGIDLAPEAVAFIGIAEAEKAALYVKAERWRAGDVKAGFEPSLRPASQKTGRVTRDRQKRPKGAYDPTAHGGPDIWV